MRILLLAPYPPFPPRGGGALRMYNLLRGLSRRHEITCLSFAPDEPACTALEPLREFCHLETVPGPPHRGVLRRAWTTLAVPQPDMALRNASSAYRKALHRLLQHQTFDIVQAASIEMAGYGLLARQYGARLLLDEFNAEYVLQRRAALNDLRRWQQPRALIGGLYSLLQWRKLAAYERRLLAAYDAVLVVSEEDRQALRRLTRAGQIAIVPNGVDCDYFLPRPAASRPTAQIVFTGTLDFRPNIDAVHWFATEVLPLVRAQRHDLRFVVVGRNPAPALRALHDGIGILVLGEVPDVRPYIADAAVYVVPMRIGGGVRLKLLEALAMQAPTISTRMGAQGVDGLQQGRHLLLADQADAFARALLTLLDQPAWSRQLGTAGRQLVQAHYDWQVIVPLLEKVYDEVMNDGQLE